MASLTLPESAVLTQDQLIAGIIETIITVNPMFEVMPFMSINNRTLAYSREEALGDVQVSGVNTTITAKNPSTYTEVTSSLTTIVGDAVINNLIAETEGDTNDQRTAQIMGKAKRAARQYQDMFINGTGASNQFSGLINLVAESQKVDTGANGGPISFRILDDLISKVIDKDGQVDWMCMNIRTMNSLAELYRNLGGAGIVEVMTMPSGRSVPMYRSVPIYRNDWIPIDQVKGGGSAQTTIFAGTWDEGGRENGIAGLTPLNNAGIGVVPVGQAENSDDTIDRVRWYCGLANFSQLGLASADGITN